VQVSWRVPPQRGHVLSRAHYTGNLRGDAIVWSAELGLELFSDETATLALLPRSVPLDTLLVDGRQAPILIDGNHFATLVKGVGRHTVTVGFQTAVILSDGPPRASLNVPQIPISRFDLSLPGKKELSVSPQANVITVLQGGRTLATVHAPLTAQLTFTWSDAVPDEVRAEVRANATLYHAIHAEEGVLYVHALIAYEISRGSMNRLELVAPADVQINQISSPAGAVADWRLAPGQGGSQIATVFLNRAVEGELRLDVHYDRALGAPEDGIVLPLLQAEGAQRERGMLALLASQDLTLDPGEAPAATRVGENQLPAFVRDAIDKTIAHTFKYVEKPKRFSVQARVPDPVRGRFDVQVDTLVSLGDVAVSGSTTAELNIKSGRIAELQIELPAGVNLLSLSAPSLRTYEIETSGDHGIATVEFTQEMEGQFRIELVYERLLEDTQGNVEVPRLRVLGAEVEQGRIAVEALSAVEVQPAGIEQLTPLDLAELPQQLILRTTNPILMAYKYLHAEPAPRLTLTLTRHRTASVQEATIDKAEYRTLFTRDGLSVTTAEFLVRNARKQFLRLRLPEDSEVWSVFVDGRAEKPALPDAVESAAGRTVLVKMVHSTEGFPVRLVYATRGPAFGALGVARGSLPHPDVLVTSTRWDVYLPDGMRYRTPVSSMSAVTSGELVSQDAMRAELAGRRAALEQSLNPLRIDVPTAGVHYAFEKLYANQSDSEVGFSLPYASGAGSVAGPLASALGAVLVWTGLGLYFWRVSPLPARMALGLAALGGVVVLTATGVYHVSATPAIVASVLLAAGALYARRALRPVVRRAGLD
jgi:hypothetical protein